jgi:hypothetical protein
MKCNSTYFKEFVVYCNFLDKKEVVLTFKTIDFTTLTTYFDLNMRPLQAINKQPLMKYFNEKIHC